MSIDSDSRVLACDTIKQIKTGDVDERSTGVITGTIEAAIDMSNNLPPETVRVLNDISHYVARMASALGTLKYCKEAGRGKLRT